MINLRKTRDLFLLLALVAVLVVAVVLTRARLLQVPTCCSEGRRACIGHDGATTQDKFSPPHAVPGFVAVLTADEIQKTASIQSSESMPTTVHAAFREHVWRYAPKTSPPGFLA